MTLATACVGLAPAHPPEPAHSETVVAPERADLTAYLATLERMAPGDATRQANEIATTLAAVEQFPSASNQLRYAIALGSAGHPGSNPIEARQRIAALLAGRHDLKAEEVVFANAYLREFESRVALYADIARQREEFEQKLQSSGEDEHRRNAALAGENARLRKALAEAERKLSAVAEIERTLLENEVAAPADEPTTNP